MKKNKIKVGIIGASGYTGSELIRLLLLHPNIELKFALSKTNKNKKIVFEKWFLNLLNIWLVDTIC